MEKPGFVDAPPASVSAKVSSTPLRKSSKPIKTGTSLQSLLDQTVQLICEFIVVAVYSCLPYLNTAFLYFLISQWRILWPFLLAYCTFAYGFDRATPFTGGTDRYKELLAWRGWNYFRDYFSAELIKTAELDPRENYIFGYHPHGIYCYGLLPNFMTETNHFSRLFPGIKLRMTTLDVNWWFPVWREIQLALGVVSVSARSLKYVLTKMGPGRGVMVVLGGADEALLAYPGTNDIILEKRKGFVKLAIQTGAHLVPVFTFGESDIYYQISDQNFPSIRRIQDRLAKLCTFTLPIVWGRFLMMPRRVKLVSVVGAPIKVFRQEHPTREYVAEIHRRYVNELVALYHAHKDLYAKDRVRELRIVG
ncbi:diacylglycerol acyltransferase-domain-containing protein [Phlyctochytrium arcticum]|nr:diacylglycerol acyltransferase-domain-containing protein [Phlyctochytrium arcticum]